MSFYELQFPKDIAGASIGGPQRVTDIVRTRSGSEEANSIWADSLRKWDAAYGVKTRNDLHTVLEFWEVMRGRLHHFRWHDDADFKSVAPDDTVTPLDQLIGTGDGALTAFQLVKSYEAPPGVAYVRTLKKPVAGTVRVSVNAVEIAISVDFTVDTTTGIVTINVAPPAGQLVKAGFEFDVSARFDMDHIQTQLELYKAGTAQIVIEEVRPK